ncbi:hypothetical protein Mal52_30330 [Symmachiella dynata]|uniref:Uncharacterized protein n=1 Tax=Symmachiella dynata TaxID=2527995 RepID=A0A517ZPY1_9PLAN|nr:hypothetical protein Mal52_30330 [Symmachiella dynata]
MYHNKVVKSVDAQARFDITPRLNTIEDKLPCQTFSHIDNFLDANVRRFRVRFENRNCPKLRRCETPRALRV